MTEHDEIRELLVLAAACALEPAEQLRLEQHLIGCAACAAEWEQWRELAGALRRLPTPRPPPALIERVRARAEAELAREAEGRWNRAVMAFLVLFAWTVTLASWPITRLVGGEVLGWLDVRINPTLLLLAGSSVLAWLTAGVAAVLLGLRHCRLRRPV